MGCLISIINTSLVAVWKIIKNVKKKGSLEDYINNENIVKSTPHFFAIKFFC